MGSNLRLIIFDVDGTLVDSQGDIVAAMTHAFDSAGLAVPDRAAILSIVGLSLDVAIPRLAPDQTPAGHAAIVQGYKDAYMSLRAQTGAAQSSPFYPGARDALADLSKTPENLLGVATGKSRRGLDKLLDGHDIRSLFVTQQTADHHPSKPHPSMIRAAMAETGVEPHQTVMIGDTSFDMEMGKAAGVATIGVSWGYHTRDALTAADNIIDSFAALPDAILRLTGHPA